MRVLRFFFDAGSGVVLWSEGYPADLELLPIDADLAGELERLTGLYDTSLNWNSPMDPGPWREAECVSFDLAVRQALTRLRDQLGAEWQVDEHLDELHEDPDLDRYLADPHNFRR